MKIQFVHECRVAGKTFPVGAITDAVKSKIPEKWLEGAIREGFVTEVVNETPPAPAVADDKSSKPAEQPKTKTVPPDVADKLAGLTT